MNILHIAFWICTAAFALPSFVFGYQKITQKPEKVAEFIRWGYSKTFMIALGFAEILAALGLFFHQTRLLCIGIWVVILVGAVGTHVRAKDPKGAVMAPVFVGILLAVVYALSRYL
jgi:putative oxidoreductase